jgi:hypothetical protein
MNELSVRGGLRVLQSAVMLQDGAPVFDSLPFEQLQALCVPLVFYKNRMTLSDEPLQPVRVALVGVGGGTTPMTIQAQFPGATDMDVVELSQAIVDVACNHFGVRAPPPGARAPPHQPLQNTVLRRSPPGARNSLPQLSFPCQSSPMIESHRLSTPCDNRLEYILRDSLDMLGGCAAEGGL